MTTHPAPPKPDLAAAREHFLSLVEQIRPDLHRYAARIVGSAIDGEDVVQDTLAKAFYTLSQSPEVPALRPWLFRIARNTAIDHLRRAERRLGEALPDEDVMADDDCPPDPLVMHAALSSFMVLPVRQRSAVILKDVLGESLEDIAAHLETSVEAVKALLVRGRELLKARLAAAEDTPPARPTPEARASLQRYVSLFNRRDWTGVQSMLLEECRLDLVSKTQRQGKAVGMYFGRYAQETGLTFKVGRCEGRDAIGVFREVEGAEALAYVILVEFEGDKVAFIRDFRYVDYLARELVFEAV
jgi:RNA polymerase sigma-70 factor (ECF subfamily)